MSKNPLSFRKQQRRWRSRSREQRGSTLLIVLALLSVLVLLAATLSFTSRIEVISSQNFADSVQRRTLPLPGIMAAAKDLRAGLPEGPVSEAQLLAAGSGSGAPANLVASADSRSVAVPARGEHDNALIRYRVTDASGRLNINAADEETLYRFFSAVAAQAGGSGADAKALARAIVQRRLGDDGAPGLADKDDNRSARFSLDGEAEQRGELPIKGTRHEAPRRSERLQASCFGTSDARLSDLAALRTGQDEPEEFVADLRYPSFGDDYRFQALSELLELPGMTPQLYVAAEPHMTLFSTAKPPLQGPQGEERGPIDLNRASAQEIYNALATEYAGEKDDQLLRQFAVNIVDARDPDFAPTSLADLGGMGVVLGVERVPFITEIYADSRSEGPADAGEYVEIYNPWPDSFDLTGWSLSVNGAEVPLSGILPSEGFLIVTDNYRSENAEDLPGLGSFYDVHGVVEAGSGRRIIEYAQLTLPHQGGGPWRVDLQYYGTLADRFEYMITQPMNTLMSFQRPDTGIVREVAVAHKSPFALAPAPLPEDAGDRAMIGPQDVEFTSPLELFEVFSGFAAAGGAQGSRWSFPAMASPASRTEENRNLAFDPYRMDARILDLFTVEPANRDAAAKGEAELDPWKGDLEFLLNEDGSVSADTETLEALAWQRLAAPEAGQRHGLVNVNTASEPVLVGAGFTQQQAATIVEERQRLLTRAQEGSRADAGSAAYQRLSDVFVDEALWGSGDRRDHCERLNAFAPLLDRVTTTSSAFLLEGQALGATDSGTVAKKGLRLRALVAFDKPEPELVRWEYIP